MAVATAFKESKSVASRRCTDTDGSDAVSPDLRWTVITLCFGVRTSSQSRLRTSRMGDPRASSDSRFCNSWSGLLAIRGVRNTLPLASNHRYRGSKETKSSNASLTRRPLRVSLPSVGGTPTNEESDPGAACSTPDATPAASSVSWMTAIAFSGETGSLIDLSGSAGMRRSARFEPRSVGTMNDPMRDAAAMNLYIVARD